MGARHCTPIAVYDCDIHVSPCRLIKPFKDSQTIHVVIWCGTSTILALWVDRLGEYMCQLGLDINSDLTYYRSMNVSLPHPSLSVLVLSFVQLQTDCNVSRTNVET